MAEAPLVSDGKVVNVTSSIVMTPLIRSGPCSDMKGWSPRVAFVRSDGKVVNVTSSIVMTPLIRSGPCSDMKGWSPRVAFVRRTSGMWSPAVESMRAERTALLGYSLMGTVLRRVRVVGSISKTVSPGRFRGGAMPGSGESEIGGVLSQRVFRTCSSVLPSRLELRHVWGKEAP